MDAAHNPFQYQGCQSNPTSLLGPTLGVVHCSGCVEHVLTLTVAFSPCSRESGWLLLAEG